MFLKKVLFAVVLLMYSFLIYGCETPEGGSSLPWSRPESWETQTLPSLEE